MTNDTAADAMFTARTGDDTMTDAPTWDDRYHPRRLLHSGTAPKGWDPDFRFAPYLRADTAIARDAPELVALVEGARRVLAHYAIVHAGARGGYRTAGQSLIAEMADALTALDARLVM